MRQLHQFQIIDQIIYIALFHIIMDDIFFIISMILLEAFPLADLFVDQEMLYIMFFFKDIFL